VKNYRRVVDDPNHESFHQLIILDDSFESWKLDKTSHEKILPSKRFITWRDLTISKERTQAPYPLSEKCALDNKYMELFLVGHLLTLRKTLMSKKVTTRQMDSFTSLKNTIRLSFRDRCSTRISPQSIYHHEKFLKESK
jgi:hypothetical protein